jgi:hypothetical protein
LLGEMAGQPTPEFSYTLFDTPTFGTASAWRYWASDGAISEVVVCGGD